MSSQPLTDEMRTNFRNLYADVSGMACSRAARWLFCPSMLPGWALPAFQMSLLTAGPAVANLLISIPAGQWMRNKPLVGVAFWSSIGQRLGFCHLRPAALPVCRSRPDLDAGFDLYDHGSARHGAGNLLQCRPGGCHPAGLAGARRGAAQRHPGCFNDRYQPGLRAVAGPHPTLLQLQIIFALGAAGGAAEQPVCFRPAHPIPGTGTGMEPDQ